MTADFDPLPADVLAIAAHRDDVEQTCGGTLLRMAARGLRTAILDLTQGETGTRGSAEERANEATEAARLLDRATRDTHSAKRPDPQMQPALPEKRRSFWKWLLRC